MNAEMEAADRKPKVVADKSPVTAGDFAVKEIIQAPGLVDNRPVAIAQRIAQRMADDSPQVRQVQTAQRMADGSVMQMKAFSTSVLNVAGEDHNESNDRRAREEYVTKWVTNGGYWTEQEFKVMAAGSQVDADPKILRFLRNLHVLRRMWDTLVRTTLSASFIPAHAKQLWISTGPLIGLARDGYADSVGDRYSGGVALTQEEGQKRDNINRVRHAHFDSAWRALQGLNALDPYQKEDKTQVEELLKQFKSSADMMVSNLMERENLDELRSKAMHEAAQTNSNSVGVWKVGESHVSDIKNAVQDDQLAYNLMTQDEFNDEYDRLDLHEVPD